MDRYQKEQIRILRSEGRSYAEIAGQIGWSDRGAGNPCEIDA